MMHNLALFLLLVIFSKVNTETEENSAVDKRLLLDDPQTVTAQMLSLQREIQTLRTKIAEIDVHQSQIQLLNSQVAQLQQENAVLKNQMSQGSLSHDVQVINTKLASFETFKSNLDQEFPQLQLKVDTLTKENNNLKQHSGSTTFPIWGKKSCPNKNGTELVYTGITGGKESGNTGSGPNTLCLPHDPDSLPANFPTATYSNDYARLYGSEYEFTYKNVAIDDDVPCAICKVQPATETIMVPAKLSCPANWTLQYSGYLASSYYAYYPTEYICIDSNPEYFEGLRQVNSNGHRLFPVKAICGSLPCPPYKANQYISCAVCTL